MKNLKHHFWEIGKISFPLTLAAAAGTLLVFIDSLFATRVSIETYEAVFLTLPIMGAGTGIGIGLAAAIADLIAKEKDLVNIKRLLTASFLLSFLSMLVFLYLAIFQIDWIERVAGLQHLEEDSPIINEFRKYWKVILWTFPVQILFSLTIQFLTILEKQKAGIYTILAILLLNIVLDYVFTQVLSWGAEGLAYSTMGVFSAGILFCLFPLKNEAYFQLPYPKVFNRAFLKAFGQLTLNTLMIFMSVVIFSIAGILLNKMALSISTAALVTYAVFRQIMEFIILTTRGLLGGFIIYMGNAIRDKATASYFPIYWAATAWIAIINITGMIFLFFFPNLLISFFENIDEALIPDIKHIFLVGILILFVFILPRMAQIGFISLNKSALLVINSVTFVIIQLVAAYYWTKTHGVFGLAYAELLACLSSLLIFVPLYFYLLNQAKKDI